MANAAEASRRQPEFAHGLAFEPAEAIDAANKPHELHDMQQFAAAE